MEARDSGQRRQPANSPEPGGGAGGRVLHVIALVGFVAAIIANQSSAMPTQEDQKSALLEWKDSLADGAARLKPGWDLDTPLCEWGGATCFGAGVMYHLELKDLELAGTLPSQLSTIRTLEIITLVGNNFTGPIPEAWSVLTSLGSLNMRNNALQTSLPGSMSTLMNLESLILARNSLSGPLPESWSTLTRLSLMSLRRNQLTGALPSSWAMKGLKFLYLAENNLTGTLPALWTGLESIQQLDLMDNEISGPLPDAWSALSGLNQLTLDLNDISGSLPPSWKSITTLQELRLSNNEVTGSLPRAWSALPLSVMALHDNNLTGQLPTEYSALAPTLQTLYLGSNNLTGTIPSTWSALTALRLLNLTRTSITSGAPAAWAGREDLEVLLGNAPSEENEARGTVSTQLPDDDTEVIGIAAPGTENDVDGDAASSACLTGYGPIAVFATVAAIAARF